MAAPETAAPTPVSDEAHGWLYDAITGKLGTTVDVVAMNDAAGSRIGFTIAGKPFMCRMETLPEETA